MAITMLTRFLSSQRVNQPPHVLAFLLGLITSISWSGTGHQPTMMAWHSSLHDGGQRGLQLLPGAGRRQSLVDDSRSHRDNASIAQRLRERIPIYCVITTNFARNGSHVKTLQETWGKRCDHFVVTSLTTQKVTLNDNLTSVHLNSTVTTTTRFSRFFHAIDYLCPGACSSHPWFLIVGDRSYIIVENLRLFLLGRSPDEPVYAELADSNGPTLDYPAVLSRAALQAMAGRNASLCPQQEEGPWCLEQVGIKRLPTQDSFNRSRVHSRTPYNYATRTVYGLSDISISFHTSSVNYSFKRNLEFFIYHLRPYGIKMGLYHDVSDEEPVP